MSVRKRLERLEKVSPKSPILVLPDVEFYSRDGRLVHSVSGLCRAPDDFSERLEPVIFSATAKIDGLEDIKVERLDDEEFSDFSNRLNKECENALRSENRSRFLPVGGWSFAWH
ncbi:MAG: hypothetical protein AB3N07_06875 [Ruegeria sp.]